MSTSTGKKVLTRLIIPIVILLAAVGVAMFMISQKKVAEVKEVIKVVPKVDVIVTKVESLSHPIMAQGQIVPSKQVVLAPMVSGKIVYVSPKLALGQHFKKGELLLRVDPSDYNIAIEQAKIQVSQAKTALLLEKGRGDVSRKEWSLLGKNKDDESKSALLLRKPQLENAQNALKNAEIMLKKAELNLWRCSLRSPFNSVVLKENVEVGMFVGPQAQAVTLYGSDAFWVKSSLSVHDLSLLNLEDNKDIKVDLTQSIDGKISHYEAKLLRAAAALEPGTRSAQVIIEINKPFEMAKGELPLLPNAFVKAVIQGPENQVVAIPEKALHSGKHVYVVDKEEKLNRREIEISWFEDSKVYISKGLDDGDRLIVSPLVSAIEGMSILVRKSAQQAGKGASNVK